MKIVLLTCLVTAFSTIECNYTFLGTNELRPLVYHHDVQCSSDLLKKRIKNPYFNLPSVPSNFGKTIEDILAYDLTGPDFNFRNLQMKSERERTSTTALFTLKLIDKFLELVDK